MRYDDNLAYDYDYYDDYYYTRERVSKVKNTKKRKKRISEKEKRHTELKRERAVKRWGLLKKTVYVIILCASASFMITKYVELDAIDKQVRNLKNEVETMRSSTSQKIIEMEQGIDLDYIEKQATDKLDMKRPEKYQQIYVDVKRDDVTEVTAREAEGFKKRAGELIDSIKRNIVDHFSIR